MGNDTGFAGPQIATSRHSRMVGRSIECRHLADAVEQGGRTLIFTGVPGSGRTTLVEQGASMAARAKVAVGRVVGGAGYLVFEQAWAATTSVHPLDEVFNESLAADFIAGGPNRRLFVDDVQDLSPAALENLLALCRLVPAEELSIVVSARAGSRRDPVHAELWIELSRRYRTTSVTVGPLTAEQTREMISTTRYLEDSLEVLNLMIDWTEGNVGLLATALSRIENVLTNELATPDRVRALTEQALQSAIEERLETETPLRQTLVRLAHLFDGLQPEDITLLAKLCDRSPAAVAEELDLLCSARSLVDDDGGLHPVAPYQALLDGQAGQEFRMGELRTRVHQALIQPDTTYLLDGDRAATLICTIGPDGTEIGRDAVIAAAARLAYSNPQLSRAALNVVDPSGVLALLERPIVLDHIDGSNDRRATIDSLATTATSMPDRYRFDTLASAIVTAERTADEALTGDSIGHRLLREAAEREWESPQLNLSLASTLSAAGRLDHARELMSDVSRHRDELPQHAKFQMAHLSAYLNDGCYDIECVQEAVDGLRVTREGPAWQLELAATYLADGYVNRAEQILDSCTPPNGRERQRYNNLRLLAGALNGRFDEVASWSRKQAPTPISTVGALGIALTEIRLGNVERARRWCRTAKPLHMRWQNLGRYVASAVEGSFNIPSTPSSPLWTQLRQAGQSVPASIAAIEQALLAGLVDPALHLAFLVSQNDDAEDAARSRCRSILKTSSASARAVAVRGHFDRGQTESTLDLGSRFTETDRKICLLVADGLTNREIADSLLVSPHTVSNRLKRIFSFFDVRNRTALSAAYRAWVEENPPALYEPDHAVAASSATQ